MLLHRLTLPAKQWRGFCVSWKQPHWWALTVRVQKTLDAPLFVSGFLSMLLICHLGGDVWALKSSGSKISCFTVAVWEKKDSQNKQKSSFWVLQSLWKQLSSWRCLIQVHWHSTCALEVPKVLPRGLGPAPYSRKCRGVCIHVEVVLHLILANMICFVRGPKMKCRPNTSWLYTC